MIAGLNQSNECELAVSTYGKRCSSSLVLDEKLMCGSSRINIQVQAKATVRFRLSLGI
jgi:hypothetical protein